MPVVSDGGAPRRLDHRRSGLRGLATLELIDRAYLLGRGALLATFGLGVFLGFVVFEGVNKPAQLSAYIAALGILSLTSLYSAVSIVALKRPSSRAMVETLPFDLVAGGLLVWATGPYEDPVYPWLLAMAISLAAVVKQRRTWVVSVLCAATYMIGHLIGHPEVPAAGHVYMLSFKAGALIVTGWLVADMMQRQLDRDAEMSAGRDAVAKLNEQLGRRLAELQAVSEITEVIHSTLDFEDVGPLVLDIVSKVIDMPSACLFVIDKEKAETLLSVSSGIPPAGWRAYGEQVAMGAMDEMVSGGETFACSAIIDHKSLMVVFCAPTDALARMAPEDRLVLQAVGSELLVGVENSQLYKLTKRLSITDALTGLNNYRYLQQRLEDEIERARRYNRSLSLLMLDADDFKGFNDTYGHLAGDTALAELAQVLREAVREIDVVCRYGGEEFSIVLPETDAEGAFVVAEKVREAVASHAFLDDQDVRRVHMTVSIGLATFPSLAADREDLLRQADDALYQAKHLGRDRVRAPRSATPGRTGEPEAPVLIEGGIEEAT